MRSRTSAASNLHLPILCTTFVFSSVRAAESAGEFVSQKTIRRVQREFSEVHAISSEALREVELRSTQEEEENGALNSTKPLLRCLSIQHNRSV